MALSGEGGDELFGGYYTYVADLLAPRLGRLAALASPLVEALPSSDRRVGFDYKAKRFARAAADRRTRWSATTAGRRSSRPHRRARAAGGAATPAGTRSTSTASATRKPPAPSRWRGCRTSTSGSTWPTTCWSRPTGSAWPTRWSCGSPSSTSGWPSSRWRCRRALKVRGFAKKRLLRRALAPLLPQRDRARAQAGLLDPARGLAARGRWSRSHARCSRPATLERQGCLDPGVVTPLLDRHCSGREDLSRQLWGLMAFTLWFDRYAV